MFQSWIIIISASVYYIKPTYSQSSLCASIYSWVDCDINCDGNPTCVNKIMTCPSGRNCIIDCYYSGGDRRLLLNEAFNTPKHHQRNLLSVYTCSSYGCCGSTIYCPANKYCEIDCTRGCNGVTIYAQDSTQLLIKNCNQRYSANYCGNMEIHCPFTGRGGSTKTCTIQGDSNSYEIEDSNIYSQEGFNDIYFDTLHTSNTKVHCGKTGTEFSCFVAADGSICDTGEPIICSNFILPTPEPTIEPSNSPSPEPTSEPSNSPSPAPTYITNNPSNSPTKFPSKHPTKYPTKFPTMFPSKFPTISPTNNPTITPTTKSPSVTPTKSPTIRPTTHAPTLHAPTLHAHHNPTISPTVIVTTNDEEDNIDDNDTKTNKNNADFWQSTLGFDLEVILIAFCAVLLMCCICLFICYWCRKEHVFRQIRKENRERSQHLASPLLQSYKKNANLEIQSFDDVNMVKILKNNDGLNSPVDIATVTSNGESDSDEDDLELGDMNTAGGGVMEENNSDNMEGAGSKFNDENILDEIDNINDDDILGDINENVNTHGEDGINNVNVDEFVVENNNGSDNQITPHGNKHLLKNDTNDDENFVVDDIDSENDDNLEITQGFIQ